MTRLEYITRGSDFHEDIQAAVALIQRDRLGTFEVGLLWPAFSQDYYSAGFMTVSDASVSRFLEWLDQSMIGDYNEH